jgi:CBS domain-containing protein/sporulation protein YlmC with PRC-barrel domain
MPNTLAKPQKGSEPTLEKDGFRFLYLALLLGRAVCTTDGTKIGKLNDMVFQLKEPYPEAVGLFLEFGWGKPTQFIPWDKVVRIEKERIVVQPPAGEAYDKFVDQPGWMLADNHLIGRTILDLDGRRTEVVNDVQLLESKGHMLLVHVDASFSGILRRWRLGGLRWVKEELISWKYVQPLSVEDAAKTDKVSLSVARKQLKELPPEDLADALEELSGQEQEALFSALEPEKAAEVLVAAEPRAQRQIIADLRKERARGVLTEMSIPQLANLFSVLPHSDVAELLPVLPSDVSSRIQSILAAREAKARDLMGPDFIAFPPDAKTRDALAAVRSSKRERADVSYVYVTSPDKTLLGVVDLRELVLASDTATLRDLMASPVVTAEESDVRDDVEALFVKYHYRLIPVVDAQDKLLGTIRYNDIVPRPDALSKE